MIHQNEHAGHHAHSHGSHDHAHGANEQRIAIAATLTGLFMLAEIAGGLLSGSLALLADAGHMFVDFAALALAFFAIRLARRPADLRRTFGYGRFQILVAYSNGLVLFAVAAVIIFEAAIRLTQPVEVLGTPMLIVASAGLIVNIAAFFILHGGDREDLNLRGAFLHVIGDLLGSVAAIAASLVILWTGWTPIDPILSVLVAVLILGNAYGLVRDAAQILLDGTPSGVDPAEVAPHLRETFAAIDDIHHVHVWAITSQRRAATLHVRVGPQIETDTMVRDIKRELSSRFAIAHVTVEIERGPCADEAHQDCLGDAVDDGHAHDHGHDHDQANGHRHAGAHA